MRIFVMAAQKGGTGKTTLSANLSIAAINAGAGPVYLYDGDPQQTLTSCWAGPRKQDVPTLMTGSIQNLTAALAEMKQQSGTLLVDTPPSLGREIAALIALADFVLVPVQPSPVDLDAAGATVDLLVRANKPFCFVLNRASKRSRWTVPVITGLSQHGPVSPVLVHDWTSLRDGFMDGTSILETAPASDAATEITALWAYLDSRLPVNQSIKKQRRKSING